MRTRDEGDSASAQQQLNDGKVAWATTAKTPAWRWQRQHHNNSNNARVMRATTPAWWGWQCQCNEGNDASTNDDASGTRATAPELCCGQCGRHRRKWQQCSTMRATMPAWQGWQRSARRVIIPARQGNNASTIDDTHTARAIMHVLSHRQHFFLRSVSNNSKSSVNITTVYVIST